MLDSLPRSRSGQMESSHSHYHNGSKGEGLSLVSSETDFRDFREGKTLDSPYKEHRHHHGGSHSSSNALLSEGDNYHSNGQTAPSTRVIPFAAHYLLMLIDGIGLSLICGCTILEAFKEWNEFHKHYFQFNIVCLSLLVSGRICQVFGLLSLTGYALSLETAPDFEKVGMIMLTIGPILSGIAGAIFDAGGIDDNCLLNKQWILSEMIELFGIILLDLSFLEDYLSYIQVFMVEAAGFFFLALAALLEFNFSPIFPRRFESLENIHKASLENSLVKMLGNTHIRTNSAIHLFDCLGLILLTVVSYFQYVYHVRAARRANKDDDKPFRENDERQQNSV